ncbi:TPA: glycosyltransferase family 4 protein [Escherichia coli]|nr:glycosyltransferase family 4 protein [Escherichia coli]HAZ3599881.1 glycosyltransferase family 4 protein [Escherichia coli]
MRDALMRAGCRRLVAVVPPGFDFRVLRRELAEPIPEHIERWLNDRPPAPIIVQTGRLRPEKGHDFMLSTLFSLKQAGHRFYWLIVGGGKPEEERRLRNAIRHLGMDDCVLMCGQLSPVGVTESDANRREPFGIALVEAAACGVPVMASHVDGIPSVIRHGHTGTLLPPNEQQVWLEALTRVLADPSGACEMAARAREDMERFCIGHTVNRLLSLGELYR